MKDDSTRDHPVSLFDLFTRKSGESDRELGDMAA